MRLLISINSTVLTEMISAFGRVRKIRTDNKTLYAKNIESEVRNTISSIDLKQPIVWILTSLLAVAIFFAPTSNWSWDPSYYYAQLRSPIIENDLDFRNETQTGAMITKTTVTGLQGSPWPIGPSIVWSPFFLAAHLYMKVFNPLKANGVYFPYITLVSLGSAVYGIGGMAVIYKIIRLFGNRFIAAITTCLCLFATAAFYYIFRQPIMAHTTSLLASAGMVLIYLWLLKDLLPRKISGFLFGVLLGLNFILRWSGILVIILPISYYASRFIQSFSEKNPEERKNIYIQVILMIGSFFLTISPQMSLWYRLYGSFLAMPQGTNTFIQSLLPLNALKVIFDADRGVFFWSPFVLLSMLGLAFIPDKLIRNILIAYIIALIILIGYREDWYGGGGYSTRYFIETLPFLALGYVSLFRKASKQRVGKLLLLFTTALLIAHQFVLLFSFEHGLNISAGFNQFLHDPSAILTPIPNVALDRQAVLINLLAGVKGIQNYVVTGSALILSPIITIVLYLLIKRMQKAYLPLIALGTMIYMLIWSIYLLVVG